MTRHRLDGADGNILRRRAKRRLDRLGLTLVVHVRRRAVRVDVVDVRGRKSRILDGTRHALRLIFAVRRRACDVIGIGVRTVADKLGVDVRTALLGMLQAFQNHESCTLAHDEAAAVFVKGTRGMCRIVVVIGAKSLHRAKACDGGFGDARFRAAGDGDVRLADLYGTERMSDAVRPRRTGRHDARRRAVQAVGDGDLPRRHVGNHHRDKEGADTLGTLVKKALIGAVHRLNAADARTDIRTDTVTILAVKVKPRIRNRHTCRHNGKLGIAVHALCLFLVDVTVDAKVLDLARNLRSIPRCIKAGDTINAVFPRKQS